MSSFVNADKIKEAIKKQASPVSPPSEQPENKNNAKDPDSFVDAQLPKEVSTTFGLMPYSTFKTRFSSVFEQVIEKSHLVFNSVSMEFKVGAMHIKLRTLSSLEKRALTIFAPDPKLEYAAFTARWIDKSMYTLVLCCAEIDGKPLPPITVTRDNLLTWFESEAVKKTLNFFDSLDDEFIQLLSTLQADLELAKRFALIENLKNL